MESDPRWTGIQLGPDHHIHAIAYADDTALGLSRDGDWNQAHTWIHTFERASGGRVNWDKSSLLPLGPWKTHPPNWELPPGLKWETGEDPSRYLGVELGDHPLPQVKWERTLEKATQSTKVWAKHNLSIWGTR